jgi:hypothetical protein
VVIHAVFFGQVYKSAKRIYFTLCRTINNGLETDFSLNYRDVHQKMVDSYGLNNKKRYFNCRDFEYCAHHCSWAINIKIPEERTPDYVFEKSLEKSLKQCYLTVLNSQPTIRVGTEKRTFLCGLFRR